MTDGVRQLSVDEVQEYLRSFLKCMFPNQQWTHFPRINGSALLEANLDAIENEWFKSYHSTEARPQEDIAAAATAVAAWIGSIPEKVQGSCINVIG